MLRTSLGRFGGGSSFTDRSSSDGAALPGFLGANRISTNQAVTGSVTAQTHGCRDRRLGRSGTLAVVDWGTGKMTDVGDGAYCDNSITPGWCTT
jgi:hypothetical protein